MIDNGMKLPDDLMKHPLYTALKHSFLMLPSKIFDGGGVQSIDAQIGSVSPDGQYPQRQYSQRRYLSATAVLLTDIAVSGRLRRPGCKPHRHILDTLSHFNNQRYV